MLSPILTICLFGLSVIPFPLYAISDSDIHLIQSDATGVSFDYIPAPVRRDTVVIRGEQFDVLTIDYCTSSIEQGRPQIPLRNVLIGLPPGAVPSVTVVDAAFTEYGGYRLAPAPTMTETDIRRLPPDPVVYTSNAFEPEGRIALDATGVMRNWYVLPVTLSPVSYSPANNRIRVYDRIRVDVRFNTPPSAFQPLPRINNDKLTAMYEASVINARNAVQWQQPKSLGGPLRRANAFGPGEWYKVMLAETGMYRIDRQTLADAGFNVDSIDPRTIRMYSGGGRVIPQDVDIPRTSLTEIPIRVTGENDGRFDENDFILFYGTALNGWSYDQTLNKFTFFQNPYTDTNVYWLTTSGTTNGQRIQTRNGQTGGGTVQTSSPARIREERELINPIESGTEWFWQLFDAAFREEATFQVNLDQVAQSGQVTAQFRFQSKTRFSHHVQVFINDNLVGESIWSGESISRVIAGSGQWLRTGINEIRIVMPRTTPGANQPDHVYFDWFELDYWTTMDASGGEIEIEQNPQAAGPTVRYQISGAPSDAQTFDVTNPLQITQVLTNNGGSFQDPVGTASPSQYHLATPERWKQPLSVVRDTKSDLRNVANGADYIIITHDSFADAADQLRAHRETFSNYRVVVARISDVYDEFAWGLMDPTAIRDFLRHAATSWTSGSPPAFAVLLGDGNYDFKNHSRSSPGIWIPPFEQGNRCADDWFVYFDGNGDPNRENDIFPDMALGRIPVQSPAQADVVVQKIIAYDSTPAFGAWRNTIVLTADDEITPGSPAQELFHVGDTERLDRLFVPTSFRVEKVYLTEFTLDAAGEKPGAREDLVSRINEGVLMVNWVGHGAANLWAHERVFNTSRDLPSITNENRLPLIVTATCTAGRFDLVNEEAMSEEFLRVEGKGAIGFIGATRLSFPGPNARLNQQLYKGILTDKLPLGIALMQAKIQTLSRENSEKYILFGDPGMQLGHPEKTIRFTSDSTDTLRVLQTAVVRGEVLKDTTIDQTFNGTAFVRTSDSAQEINYVASGGGRVAYQLPGADVFRGPVNIDQGQFTASFIVPRDITYGGNLGRVAVYATNGQTDASGTIDLLPLRGANPTFSDSLGPEIEVLVDGRPVADGEFTSAEPILTVNLFDQSGINITREVGHQITVQTDKDPATRQDITDLFTYETGSFQQGRLEYQVPKLTPGDHPLTIKAWDNFNNSSSVSLLLSVVEDTDLRVTDVMNYPNPFDGPTTFTFELTQDADVSIQVYTVAGALIQSFNNLIGRRGFNQVDWNGMDRDGDRLANGAYLYKVTARTQVPERKTVSVFGRLLVIR